MYRRVEKWQWLKRVMAMALAAFRVDDMICVDNNIPIVE
jgi:hypothetical protein